MPNAYFRLARTKQPMSRIISFLLLLLVGSGSSPVLAQADESLKRKEIREYIILADTLFGSNLDSSLLYYERAYEVAADLTKGKPMNQTTRQDWSLFAESANGRGFVLQYQGRVDSCFRYHRQCLGISVPLSLDTLTAWALNNIGMAFHRLSDLDSAIVYYRKSLDVRVKMGSKPMTQNALNNIAWIYQQRGDLDTAEKYLRRVLAINEETGDLKSKSNTLHSLGANYYQRGEYAQSLDFHSRSLRIREQTDDLPGIATSTGELSVVYQALGDYETALMYLRKSQAMITRRGGDGQLATVLNNMGLIFTKMNELDSARTTFERSLEKFEKVGDKDGIALCLGNLGTVLEKQGELGKALEYFQRSVAMRRTTGSKGGLAHSLERLGTYHSHQGELRVAEKMLSEALELAKRSGEAGTVVSVSKELSSVFQRLGSMAQAYEMLALYQAMKDSIRSPEANLAMIRQQVEYAKQEQDVADSLAHALELQSANHDKAQAELRADRNQQRAIALGASALVLGLLGGGLWLNRKRIRTKLERDTERLERKAAEAEVKALRAQIDPHFLNNVLAGLADSVLSNDKQQTYGHVTKIAKLMRAVLESSRETVVPLDSDMAVLRQYIDLERDQRGGKFDYTFNVDPAIDQSRTLIPPMLIQPFVENAIRHGLGSKESQGSLSIALHMAGEQLRIVVQDDGVGMRSKVENSGHVSIGTSLTASRLAMWGQQQGASAGFDYVEVPVGVRVEVYMPVATEPFS